MKIITLVFLLLWPSMVWAVDAQQVSKTLRITYTEPTENVDATPLMDLGGTLITVIADGVALPDIDVPATALTGGGPVVQDVVVPFSPNTLVSVDLEVSAYDTSGNASDIVPLNVTIDWLPPGKVK